MTAVKLYDTTLRDGMQGQGMSLSAAEKVRVVHALDQLGVQVLGSTLANVSAVPRLVAAMGARPDATIVGSDGRTIAAYAAYANGTLAAACEFDDAHMAASHPGSYVVPAALALGESTGASGREVVTAIIAGVQVMALLGSAALRPAMASGWHVAKIFGTFGATAVAGRLLGLDPQRLTHAFGIAGSDVSGTVECEFSGGEVKRLHPGSAGRNGIQAAQLAAGGMTGPATTIEGRHGLFRMFGGDTVDFGAVERTWDRTHIVDTVFRMYPTIGSAAPALDGVGRLVAHHDLRPETIRRIRLGVPSFAIEGALASRRPTDAVSAQFSTAFSVALLLARGGNRPADYFASELWTDPDVTHILDRIEFYATEFEADLPPLSCRIDIELDGGRRLSHVQHGFRGHPDHADTDDRDVVTKFLANVSGVLDPEAAEEIRDAVATLGDVDGVGGLMALTVP